MTLPSYIAAALLLLGCVEAQRNSSIIDECDEPFIWSAALEEWALSAPMDCERQGRVMVLPPSPGYYVVDRVDQPPPPPGPPGPHMGPPPPPPPPGPHGPHMGPPPPPGPRGPVPYSEWQPPSGPGKVVNRPTQPFRPSPAYPGQQNQHQQYPPPNAQQNQQYPPPGNHYPQNPNRGPEYPAQGPGNPHRGPGPMPSQNTIDRVDDPPKKQVTETDLYLLSAIEKLVYRVDLMEKRLRKLEENVLYFATGADKNKPEPCVANFTRVGGVCYHFAQEPVDWKSANLHCRKLRSNLLELDSDEERRGMIAAMLVDKKIRGMDVWTGGLNPGLLWIWAHSARPVLANATGDAAPAPAAPADFTIVGTGRCLALVYDPATKTYVYRGQDCALRHRYVCEREEDRARLGNEIEKAARSLRGAAAGAARQARLLLLNTHNSVEGV